jgi:hypothetical protein
MKTRELISCLHRINNRILVFVTPSEFMAVQPIVWLCTCFDKGMFIVELVNEVKSIELANHLLEVFFRMFSF